MTFFQQKYTETILFQPFPKKSPQSEGTIIDLKVTKDQITFSRREYQNLILVESRNIVMLKGNKLGTINNDKMWI